MSIEKAGVRGNLFIVSIGAYTGGNSAIKYSIITNRKVSALYAASTIFSASAITSGVWRWPLVIVICLQRHVCPNL